MWVMSPCFNTKTHFKFIIRGFGLAFPRSGPALLSRLPCKPSISCKGGRKIQKWQETAGEVVAKSWEVMEKTRVWDLGKGTDWWSAISVLGEAWLQHVQSSGKGRAQCFLLSAQSNLSSFKSWQRTCSFYFCPHLHLLQCQLTLFLPSCTPAAQTRAGKAPRWVCSPSLPCSSSLRKFKLLIFLYLFRWILPTTPIHTQEPHYILHSAQRVPTRILHSQHITSYSRQHFTTKIPQSATNW